MHRAVSSFAALAAVLAALASVTAAMAQAHETWVSDGGSNANDCLTSVAPCSTIGGGANGALAKTVAGGIVHVLPGTYSGFTIDKSIEIIADEGQAAITTSFALDGSFAAAIKVATAATDIVRVRGFEVVPIVAGTPPSGGIGGIMLQSAGILHVENCTFVRGLNGFGIVFAPTGVGELYVSNSTLSDNGSASGGGGLLVKPTGSGSAKVALDNDQIENNQVGILLDGASSTGGIDLSVAGSTISGNASVGIGVFEAVSGGSPSAIALARTTISNNGGQGIFASRSLATVRVRQSEITGNAVGVQSANGGQIISHGDNVLAGNTTNGAFTSTLPPQ